MSELVIRRLPDGSFELSGGPLVFRSAKELFGACSQMMRFPTLHCFQTGAVPKPVESLTISEESPIAKLGNIDNQELYDGSLIAVLTSKVESVTAGSVGSAYPGHRNCTLDKCFAQGDCPLGGKS